MRVRSEPFNVTRLHQWHSGESAEIVEIELDTQQLRALTSEDAAAAAHEHRADSADEAAALDPEFTNSLEALLRDAWPIWKGTA